jgi:dTMP kinase
MALRGILIALLGIDGSGKTRHADMLANWLKSLNFEVLITHDLESEPIGSFIRENILIKGIHIPIKAKALLFASELAMRMPIIENALREGKIVIADRYYYCGFAYLSAQEKIDLKWLEHVYDFAVKPDLVFLLDIDPEVAQERLRKKYGRELNTYEQNLTLQKKVRCEYLRLAKEKGFIIINTEREETSVHEDIKRYVSNFLISKRNLYKEWKENTR